MIAFGYEEGEPRLLALEKCSIVLDASRAAEGLEVLAASAAAAPRELCPHPASRRGEAMAGWADCISLEPGGPVRAIFGVERGFAGSLALATAVLAFSGDLGAWLGFLEGERREVLGRGPDPAGSGHFRSARQQRQGCSDVEVFYA